MSKAKKFGWTGYLNSWDSLEAAFEEIAKEKIVPLPK